MKENLSSHQERTQRLAAILKDHHASDYVYPDLTTDPGTLEKWIEKIKAWLENFLSLKDHNTDLDLSWLFKYLPNVIVAAIVCAGLYYLYRLVLRRYGQQAVNTWRAETVEHKAKDGMIKEIDDALAKGAVAVACRLRWKLHLERTHEETHLTPHECLTKRPHLDDRAKKVFMDSYRWMFGPGEKTREHYHAFNNGLFHIESLG
ncbi:MAG: hypothetical protein HQM16_17295, partial [Deltaproteobacteria bacterium]|nr:hypothetical protein [Deltaproteobacteria bacterium]